VFIRKNERIRYSEQPVQSRTRPTPAEPWVDPFNNAELFFQNELVGYFDHAMVHSPLRSPPKPVGDEFRQAHVVA
jgi:hypothetical protein